MFNISNTQKEKKQLINEFDIITLVLCMDFCFESFHPFYLNIIF